MPGPTTKLSKTKSAKSTVVKTIVNDGSVSDFLNRIPDQQLRKDCFDIVDMMQATAKAEPRMWGGSIIGFGEHTIQYAGGRMAQWMVTGFSPRKQNITLYIGSSFPEHDELLAQLGTHSCGKGCLYIKKLSDVHLPTLKKLVSASVKHRLKASAGPKAVAKSNSRPSAPAKAKPKSGSKAKAGSKPRSRPRG
jgi:Domain of unknown function (DU1801)